MKVQNLPFYECGFTFEKGEYRKPIRENVILKRDPNKEYWNVDVIKKDGSVNVLKIDEIKEDDIRDDILELIDALGNPVNPGDPDYNDPGDVRPARMDWKKPEPKRALAKYQPQAIPISMRDVQVQDLSLKEIKEYICKEATDQEAYMFLMLCKARNLNPFTGEVFLVKYGNQKAQTVVGKETFTRRAELNPNFDGFEAGIIIRNEDGELERRPGTFRLKEETLLGGWARVYRKDRALPFVSEVSLDEYIGKKGTGEVNQMWSSKAATMVRKVALVQSLREAFPSEFSGLYDAAEFGEETPAY
jgi:phage recombination protein Bet